MKFFYKVMQEKTIEAEWGIENFLNLHVAVTDMCPICNDSKLVECFDIEGNNILVDCCCVVSSNPPGKINKEFFYICVTVPYMGPDMSGKDCLEQEIFELIWNEIGEFDESASIEEVGNIKEEVDKYYQQQRKLEILQKFTNKLEEAFFETL